MGESQTRKDLLRILKEFKPSALPWPDVVQRLRQLKAILRQSPLQEAPPLHKSLLQCMHHSWPTGLHSEALEVMSALLLAGGEKPVPKPFTVETGVYASGLFAFYEVAAPENKLALLKIFEGLITEYSDDVSLYLPGMVASLLSGLEDPGNREAAAAIEQLFDRLLTIDEATFYSALWVAVLRTCSEGRVGGLSFVGKKKELFIPSRQLFINAMISCLGDKEVRVQRLTLDLLIAKVSLTATGRFLDEEKVAIIVAVMRLMGKGRDFSIVRRVLQWVVPEDTQGPITARICDYLAQSSVLLLATFSESDPEVRGSVATIETLLDVLEEQPELRKKLLFRLFSALIPHVYRNQSSPHFSVLLTLVSRLVPEESAFQTWQGLASDLETHIASRQAAESLSVIDFTLNYLPLNKNEAEALQPVLRLILEQFDALGPDDRLLALQIAQTLLRKVAEPPKSTGFQRVLEGCEWEQLPTELLTAAIHTCIGLHEPGAWIETVKTLSRAADPTKALIGTESISSIYTTQIYAQSLPSNTIQSAFELVWGLVCTQLVERAVELFTVWKRIAAEEFAKLICEKLRGERLKAVHTFAALWSALQKARKDAIGEMVGGREELGCLLEGLESEMPQIRHATREWLLDSCSTFGYIVDPFLEELMRYEGDVAKTPEVLKALKILRSLLQVGGDKLHTWLLRTQLSARLALAAPEPSSYFSSLVHSAFHLIQCESALETEYQSIRFSACELFESILDTSDVSTVSSMAKPLLSVASTAIQAGDSLFQLHLLNLLRLVLVRNDSSPQATEVYSGAELLAVLVASVEGGDVYLQSHWTDLICQVYPIVLRFMPGERLLMCTRQLIQRFTQIVETSDNKDHAMAGLTTIVASVVELPRAEREGTKVAIAEEFRRKKKKSEEFGWLGGWFRKVQELATAGPFEELFGVVVACFEGLMKAFARCVEASVSSPFHASPYGLEAQSTRPGSLPASLSNHCRSVLSPLFAYFPDEFFASAVSLWITHTHVQRVEKGSLTLDSQVRLFSLVGVRPSEVVEALTGFVRSRSAQFQCIYEGNVVHFIATLLVSFGSDPLTAEEQQALAYVLIPLLEDMERLLGAKTESHFWFLELTVLLSRFISFASLPPDRHTKLRDFVKRLISKICTRCSDTTSAEGPFPPSIMQLPVSKVSTQAAAFQSLSVNLYPALKLVYDRTKDLREQLRQPVSILTSGLSDKNVPMSLLSSLLYALVISEKAFITEVLRDTLTATLRSDEFFQSLEGSVKALREWGVIASALTPAEAKEDMLKSVLADIPAGMFTSRISTFRHSVKALKLASFFVYSGEEDAYCEVVGLLADKVCNEFPEDDLLPSVLLLVRMLTLKLSPDSWNEFYQRVRPYLLTRLPALFQEPSSLSLRSAALKLFELFSTLGYDRFSASQWLFLYDTPNIDLRRRLTPASGFRPVLTSYLLSDLVQPSLRQEESNISVYSSAAFTLRPIVRKVFYTKQEYDQTEEFCGEEFVTYSVALAAERVTADRRTFMDIAEKDLLYCGSDCS